MVDGPGPLALGKPDSPARSAPGPLEATARITEPVWPARRSDPMGFSARSPSDHSEKRATRFWPSLSPQPRRPVHGRGGPSRLGRGIGWHQDSSSRRTSSATSSDAGRACTRSYSPGGRAALPRGRRSSLGPLPWTWGSPSRREPSEPARPGDDPLAIDRPVPGSRVTIPAPLLTCRNVNRQGFAHCTPRNGTSGFARSEPARTLLRFQIPRELLPLRVEQAVLEVDLNAQARLFEILTGKAGDWVLASRNSPSVSSASRSTARSPEARRRGRIPGLSIGAAPGCRGRKGHRASGRSTTCNLN